jgi:DNA polymerase-3 subunit gamma/tau
MAYTVLARKYRSWTFDELVGQQAIAITLKNAIQHQRIHHGYLFCGTRGVGKTSAARILARSLNCLNSEQPTVSPCLKCESCLSIAEGQDVDVIEIDAASNTGVDNIRELRSNANYRPARSRFKVYIIDEVHMLSTGAFNALLKTLEEPPAHVKFVLATTDPQKVPATIQSRCLRFNFRSISTDEIGEHFANILKQEKIEADPEVVRRIARLANGSMRDGLSLLDQMLSMGQEKLTVEMLDDVLPVSHDEMLVQLIEQFADHDAAGALQSLDQCLSAGYSLERLTEALAGQVRTLMLLNICGPQTNLVDLPTSAVESMEELSRRFDGETFVYMITVLEELRRNVRFSALARALAEAAVVRLATAARYESVQDLLDQLGTGGQVKKKLKPPEGKQPATGGDRQTASANTSGTADRYGSGRTAESASQDVARQCRQKPAQAQPSKGEQQNNPASAPKPASNGKELKEAASDPLVREALDLFNGSLVNVERKR